MNIKPGDLIKVKEQYDEHLGIVLAIYATGLISYKPIGRVSEPLSTTEANVLEVTPAGCAELPEEDL